MTIYAVKSSLLLVTVISWCLIPPCQAFAQPHQQQSPSTTKISRDSIKMSRRGWGPSTASPLHMSKPSSAVTELNGGTGPVPAAATGVDEDEVDCTVVGEAADDDNNCVKTLDVLSLDSIRNTLIRQEETIIFALIERAQFRQNSICYKPGAMGTLGTPPGSREVPKTTNGDDECPQSFLEYMLAGTEALHCGVRRYTSPEEHAFFPDRLPAGIMDALNELEYPSDLLSPIGGACDVNFNPILLEKYIKVIVPSIAVVGDDEQHGSTVLCDIALLQALSRRVHYGKFVAESKYRSDPEGYQALVDAGDADGVMALLTNQAVEEMVLRRARLKAATYGQEPLLASLPPIETKSKTTSTNGSTRSSRDTTSIVAAAAASAVVAAIEAMGDDENSNSNNKVCPSTVEAVYRDLIIPMTKDVEVAYLFLRCGREPPPEYAPDRMSRDVTRLIL